MSQFPIKVFSSDAADRQFQHIINSTSADMSHTQIMKTIHNTLENGFVLTIPFKNDGFLSKVYRVTTLYKEFDKNIAKSYANPDYPSLGRANLKNTPVFYASFDHMSALREMKEKLAPGVKLYISEWEMDFQETVNAHSLILNSKTSKPNEPLYELVSRQEEKLKSSVSNLTKKGREAFVYSIKKMGDLFSSKGETFYHITSAYAHFILYEARKQKAIMPMLLYPSLENKSRSINFAIHPDFVKGDKMNLKQVFEITITDPNLKDASKDDGISYEVHRKGVFNGLPTPTWQVPYVEILEVDFEDFQIKTHNGSVYKGSMAQELSIENSSFTMKKYVLEHLVENDVLESLKQFDPEDEKSSPMEESYGGTHEHIILLNITEHNISIEVNNTTESIELITFAVKWDNSFREEKYL